MQDPVNPLCNNNPFSWMTMRPMHATMDRLYLAARIIKGIEGPAELGRLLNQSPQTITNWQSRGMSKSGMIASQAALGVSVTWLETGKGDMVPGGLPETSPVQAAQEMEPGLMVPVFDAPASMGAGFFAPDHDVIVGGIHLNENWVRQHLGTISSPKNLAVIPAYGDSMATTFSDGDLLLVDRGVSDVRIDAVYVLGLAGELFVKRLQRRPDGSLLMISDNKAYEPYKIANGERDQFAVLGRVVWAWNGKKL